GVAPSPSKDLQSLAALVTSHAASGGPCGRGSKGRHFQETEISSRWNSYSSRGPHRQKGRSYVDKPNSTQAAPIHCRDKQRSGPCGQKHLIQHPQLRQL